MRYATPRCELWRARLAAALDGRGRRVALARFLADGDPARLQGQQVQVSRVLRGAGFDSEFLLACEEWMRANPQIVWEGATGGAETSISLPREDSREVVAAADLGFRVKKRTARKKSTDGKN